MSPRLWFPVCKMGPLRVVKRLRMGDTVQPPYLAGTEAQRVVVVSGDREMIR